MTTINLNGLTHDELVATRVTWLKTLGSDQEPPPEDAGNYRRLLPPLLRELATGQPLEPGRLATVAGVPLERTLDFLRQTPAEWDARGERVLGFGLTSIPTPHRYQTQGRALWVWCAVDALMFPVMIGAPALIQSPCAATGDPVTVELTPASVRRVEPAGAVVGYFLPAIPDPANVRKDVCDQNNFYRSAEDASAWQAGHPAGRPLPVAEMFDVLRRATVEVYGKELGLS